ncbi:MAG TPA: TM2 domain-containing protein [Fimbriimonadaceae bacterium]|nr:TM2 domain-containing protein [Fimbriimonadaceae bacterium]
MQTDSKSFIVALLLAIFLGGLGIHRFYLGDTKMGIARIIVTVLCFVPLVGLVVGIVSLAWWVVDIVLIATRKLGPVDGSAYV